MSGTNTRSRDLSKIIRFNQVTNTNPVFSHWDASSRVWTGKQITVSEGHRKSRKDGKYHEGGPFYSVRIEPNIIYRWIDYKTKEGLSGPAAERYLLYKGPICVPVPEKLGGFSIPSQDSSYLDPVGAEAISIVDPTNPNAETGVALGEIFNDGFLPIPGIAAWKRRTEVAKAAGSEFLNSVFGWLPLIGDIQDTVQSIRDKNTILKGYVDASGSNVHREFSFPDEITESETVLSTKVYPVYSGKTSSAVFERGPGATLTRHRTEIIKRWFSGTFTYHADAENSSLQKMLGYGSDADKLFGTTLTPDVIWELAPWSWAVDWFSNAQQVIQNLGAFEIAGLVMRYGYIMEETSITDLYSMSSPGLEGLGGTIPPSSVTYTLKRRRVANPFGFGVSWDGLSPTQLAITAALGITRLL